MNGSLTKVSIPKVAAGEQIKATIGYSATNPGAYYWKTFIIAAAGTYIQKEVSATREIGQEGGGEHTYSLGVMPDKKIALGIYLFAHDDAGYDWDWNDFWAWTGGYSDPSMAQCLDYKITVLEPAENVQFNLSRPTVAQSPIHPGTPITITCGITSACTSQQTVIAELYVYEGSIWTGHGTLLDTMTSAPFTLNPGQKGAIGFNRTALGGSIDRRDVKLELYLNNKLVTQGEWDDIYYVSIAEEEKTLEIDIPDHRGGHVTTNPAPLDITNYWEDGTRGKFVTNTRVRVTAHPNEGFLFDHWSDEIQGNYSTNNPEWVSDNGYMVDNKAVKCHFREIDVKVLEWHSIGEPTGGTILLNPEPLDYLSANKGHYYKDTVVNLTAVVNSGFVFLRWHGTDNPGSTSLTNTVTMSENHTIRADFGFAEVEQTYPLEVDITPAQGGYVTTDPPPNDIANKFTNGTVGKFTAGSRVLVTAHPNTGYEFLKWSDEIQGGVSYSNPEYVSGTMNEHKAVKCHFRETGVEPPPPECSVDADCPEGYICQNGVCVPEGTPPNGGGTDWLPLLAIGAGALIILSQAGGKEKPKRQPRRRK
jgi:Cys-rich repeat protein